MFSRVCCYAILWSGAIFASYSSAQGDFKAPPTQKIDAETLQTIEERARQLRQQIRELKKLGVGDPILADIEVYLKAADWIVRHQEFYHKDSAKWTLEVLDRGLLRSAQAARGEAPWLQQVGVFVVRGYRSRVDGSVQPYAVALPHGYGAANRRYRLDVVLHGRDSSLTEVKFLYNHRGDKEIPKDQDHIQLEVYGRGNNAYRWAGETDVFEALDAFAISEKWIGRDSIDANRLVLRGFSMGGAGSWHIGLHYPDRWAVIGPGAGFTTTRGYIERFPDQLPEYQERCLKIYDAVDYAENAFQLPIVAYAGAKDKQILAGQLIEKRLQELKIPTMKFLIAPELAHQFPAEWQRKAEQEYQAFVGEGKGRNPMPERVVFTTYTLKYASCHWVELLALEKHYQQARIDATRTEQTFRVSTRNVRAFRLMLPGGVFPAQITVDGQLVDTSIFTRTYMPQGVLEKRDGQWQATLPQKWQTDCLRTPRKLRNLQGPIDDAFTDSFVCVNSSGRTWHEATARASDAQFDRFAQEWNKYMRGRLPYKGDDEITDADIATRHLILFGDPQSNPLLGQIVDRLPILWTKDKIIFDGQEYKTEDHLPMMIYPNPLNPSRYVVINSGHTFHAAEFQGTNALLYPRLGDYAIVRPTPTEQNPAAFEVIRAGLFTDEWKLK